MSSAPAPPRRSLTARIAANSSVQVAGSVGASLISLFTFAAATRALGPAAFGNFAAAISFLVIPTILGDIGLSAAVLREISQAPERTDRVMRASLPLRALVSASVVSVATGLAFVLPFNGQLRLGILIGSLGAFLNMMSLSLMPVLQAQLKMQWAVGANLSGRAVTLGLTLGALAAGLGFAAVVWAYVVGSAATLLLNVGAVAHITRLHPLLIDLPYWRSLLVGSLCLGAALSLTTIYFRLDTILLALLRPAREVGLYAAAWKFVELAQTAGSALAVSIFPTLTLLVAVESPHLREFAQKTFDTSLAAGTFLTVLFIGYARELVILGGGVKFASASIALQLLAPSVILGFVGLIFERWLIAAGRERILLKLGAAVLVLNLVLNVVFLPLYGFKAAAVVFVASELFWLLLAAEACRREFGFLPDLRYVRVVGLAAAAMAAVIALTPGPALLAGALATLVYACVLLALPGTARDLIGRLTADHAKFARGRVA